jgi:hypothetical protein
MNEKININYLIIVLITVIFLSVLFVCVNNGTINMKVLDNNLDKAASKINMPITTTEYVNKKSININGVLTDVSIDKMDSYLGFSIEYDKDNIKYDVLSNSSVLFSDINNKRNFLKIMKLSESDYNTKYELSQNNELHENELDGNSYIYSFYRIDGNYFEIIESLDDNDDFSEYLKAIFKYMISTLKEH